MNIVFIVGDLTGAKPEAMRPIASISLFLMWCKIFYFLRLFETTAPIVRMIMQIISDMKTFSFVLFLAVLGFANTFYILSLNGISYKECAAS